MASTATKMRDVPRKRSTYLVPNRNCGTGRHLIGVCAHPGSKADIGKRKARTRAANRRARASRKANRR